MRRGGKNESANLFLRFFIGSNENKAKKAINAAGKRNADQNALNMHVIIKSNTNTYSKVNKVFTVTKAIFSLCFAKKPVFIAILLQKTV